MMELNQFFEAKNLYELFSMVRPLISQGHFVVDKFVMIHFSKCGTGYIIDGIHQGVTRADADRITADHEYHIDDPCFVLDSCQDQDTEEIVFSSSSFLTTEKVTDVNSWFEVFEDFEKTPQYWKQVEKNATQSLEAIKKFLK